MLKAELEIPSGLDPYLRWSWKGKVLARGTLSKGFGQILWVAPSDQGVYTITLELFPSSPPEDSDYTFLSSLMLSTDIFVTGGKALEGNDLSPNHRTLPSCTSRRISRTSGPARKKLAAGGGCNRNAADSVPGRRLRLQA